MRTMKTIIAFDLVALDATELTQVEGGGPSLITFGTIPISIAAWLLSHG